jgi:hypothetical protein
MERESESGYYELNELTDPYPSYQMIMEISCLIESLSSIFFFAFNFCSLMSSVSNLGELTTHLIDVLSKKPVNVLVVRSLCRNNPGLIASAGLRTQAWSALLLGSDYSQHISNSNPRINEFLTEKLAPCQEQHVLEADVPRTRAENEIFRSPSIRAVIHRILQKFCIEHSIQYKQGMNEVLAPFISLLPSSAASSSADASIPDPQYNKDYYLIYSLYNAFMVRYIERFFCLDDSSFLYKSFRCFHLLLLYHDPQLANHLSDLEFSPEFYAPQWFLTLYARALPLVHVLRLWDMMISVDDPSFLFFIGLTLLINQRDRILLSDLGNIPEVISSNIKFNNEEEIDFIVKEALTFYQITPRCLLRQLRLCCVSTVELTPLPSSSLALSSPTSSSSSATTNQMKINIEEYDQGLSLQSVRNCFTITPQELIESMLTPSHYFLEEQQRLLQQQKGISTNSSEESSLTKDLSSTSSSSYIPQQYVIIDIRSYEESVLSGGGILPRAIQLEPEFLNRPEAFEVWIQHFDGTRGCNICIVDLPPPGQWNGIALWRRLLLGEGDASSNSKYSSVMDRYEFNNLKENQKRLEALIAHSKNSSKNQQIKGNTSDSSLSSSSSKGNMSLSSKGKENRDENSKFYKDEENVILSDLNSPAMILAMVLQRNSFPHVSVLEGGFPALIDTLLSVKGKVEPIVVDHESEKWIEFLRNTGRYQEKSLFSSTLSPFPFSGQGKSSKMISSKGFSSSSSFDENHESSPYKKYKEEKDLTSIERYELALVVANRLEHKEMKRILEEKLENLKH